LSFAFLFTRLFNEDPRIPQVAASVSFTPVEACRALGVRSATKQSFVPALPLARAYRGQPVHIEFFMVALWADAHLLHVYVRPYVGASRDRTGDLKLAKLALSRIELWPQAPPW
jgi:hypothetical protein